MVSECVMGVRVAHTHTRTHTQGPGGSQRLFDMWIVSTAFVVFGIGWLVYVSLCTCNTVMVEVFAQFGGFVYTYISSHIVRMIHLVHMSVGLQHADADTLEDSPVFMT